jgi:GR25 family glycosyltransferase involved in LPS biosynthesis
MAWETPLKGFYINLDHSRERRRSMEAQLKALGLADSYQRFAAIDGREVTVRPDVKNRAEVGCYLSHLEVIRRNAGQDGWLHVLEDDVLVSRYAPSAIAAVTATPAMDIYDIIFTNVRFWAGVGHTANVRDIFDRSVVVSPAGEVTKIKGVTTVALGTIDFFFANSYLVNPRSIDRTADLLARDLRAEPFRQVDHALARLSRQGDLVMACTMPFLSVPRFGLASTIQPPGVHHWDLALAIMDRMLYADRDVADLRQRLAALTRTAAANLTSEVIAEACRIVIASGGDG